MFSSQVVEIGPEDVELDQGERVRIENDFVFVFAGGVPPSRFLSRMGIRFGGEEAVELGVERPDSPGGSLVD